MRGDKFLSRQAFIALLTSFFALCAPTPADSRDEILTFGDQNLHIEMQGESGPTVVFEAGLGNDTSTWKFVAGPVAKFARVVLYDRPGSGQSVPLMDTSSTITAEHVATNLHKLLVAADVSPPYIMVGHSLGGLYVQMFARKFPDEISGVVLLDSSSAYAPSELKTRARLEPGSAAYLEEEGIAESNQQVKSAGPFPDVPLAVIAATDHGPFFKDWEPTLMHLQRQLATLSPRAELIVAEGSGHNVQLDRPGAVVDAIRRMAHTGN
jgi:pimeloyl-ACP methyl ester carboxylesterase